MCSVFAAKRKVSALEQEDRQADIIPTVQRILDRLADYEQHPADYHDGTYREPSDEDRPGYIGFYRREEKDYEYTFTLIHNNSEDDYDLTNFVMSSDHWEYTDRKSHVTIVVETYATDHGYMDKAEFKNKKQEIKDDYKSATLESLEGYAATHGVPALPAVVLQAVKKLKSWS
ncbi:MAG: hypothetical protein K6B13_09810 [Prevotella sp.]|nr:hypothetical protein [Prevotella sp.]